MSLVRLHLRARMLYCEGLTLWASHTRRRFSPYTHTRYMRAMRRFAQFAPKYLADLNPEHIERFLDYLMNHGCSSRSTNTYLTAIKSFCNWLQERHNIWKINPASLVKMLKEAPVKQRVLSEAELQKVLAVCTQRQKDILLLVKNTGLRSCELRNLHLASLDLPRRMLHMLHIVGKGGKGRSVPLNDTAIDILKRHSQSYIELTKSLQSSNALWLMCFRLSKKAGIESFGPHALRHKFCTDLWRKGKPPTKISRIMGHASIRTTERIYVHLCDEVELGGVTDCLDEK